MTQAAADNWFTADQIDTAELLPDDDQAQTVLTFELGQQVFAVDVHRVREILDTTTISPLPNAPHDVLGMIDLREQSIAIIDLANQISVTRRSRDDGRIVVFEFGSGASATLLGVPADRVLRVREIQNDTIEPVPSTLSGWQCDVATGMARTDDGIALILDIERILGGADMPGPFDFEQ